MSNPGYTSTIFSYVLIIDVEVLDRRRTRSGSVTCMINPRRRGKWAKSIGTLYCEIHVFHNLHPVRTDFFARKLVILIMKALDTKCIICTELLMKNITR